MLELMDREMYVITPDAVVYHRHRNELIAFARRRYQYGTSEPLLQSTHPDRIKSLPIYLSADYMLLGCLFIMLINLEPPDSIRFRVSDIISIYFSGYTFELPEAEKDGIRVSIHRIVLQGCATVLSVSVHHASFLSRCYLLPMLMLRFYGRISSPAA